MAGWLNKLFGLFRRKNSGVKVWGNSTCCAPQTCDPLSEAITDIVFIHKHLEECSRAAMGIPRAQLRDAPEFNDPPVHVEFKKLRKLQLGK